MEVCRREADSVLLVVQREQNLKNASTRKSIKTVRASPPAWKKMNLVVAKAEAPKLSSMTC